MRKNRSPWLHQLDQNRDIKPLKRDIDAEIVIVGAGIAGITTAFEILEKTQKNVVMLERFKLAHGATGHNAGQVVAYFERGLKSLVDEFGMQLAIQGQRDIENAWDTLERMYATAGLTIPFYKFMGRTGFTSTDQVVLRLENNALRKAGGLEPHPIYVSESSSCAEEIPAQYKGAYTLVPRTEIQRLLETAREDFIATMTFQKGTVNSALLCQEMLVFFYKRYPERFTLYELTPADKIVLRNDHALIDTGNHTVRAERVILCTNGFENLLIVNESGLDINAKYHHLVSGKRGYMSGYLERHNKDPIAISYFTEPGIDPDNSYYYLTRRPYEYETGNKHNLVCVGGPDVSLEDTTVYSREEEYPEEYAEEIDRFVRETYDIDPNRKIDYVFTWHGLMGYTKSGVRMVGPEPQNPVLLYNLGCNGVGILPSIHGATKIARHIRGDEVEKSIFDVPRDVRPEPEIDSDRDYIAAFPDWFGSGKSHN